MSEAQRFWSHEASNIRCVREADFDRVTAERDALQQRLTAADERADVLESALKFYADGDHYSVDDGLNWDSCSGEPANILWHEDQPWFIEDGSVAKAALKPAEGRNTPTCTWSSHEFSWRSNCGMEGWEFTDGGTPAENGMKFCHCCGKSISVEVQDDD